MKNNIKLMPRTKVSVNLNFSTALTNAVVGASLITAGVFFMFVVFNVSLNPDAVANETDVAGSTDITLPDYSNLGEEKKEIMLQDANESFHDVRPLISSQGNVMFFGRRYHPDNAGGKRDFQDIWSASVTKDGHWGKAKNLGFKVNNEFPNGICSVNAKGTEMTVTNEFEETGSPIAKCTKFKNGWTGPKPMMIDDYYNDNQYVDFYHSFEHKILLMAVERKDGSGNQDLYVSMMKSKDSWSAPINLGKTINTAKADFAPFLALDGKTLFFSSYGHEGLGGCDIYVSRRLDDTWQNWSKPENLGAAINSKNEESYASVTADFKYIYFESYPEKTDKRKIYVAKLPEAFNFIKEGNEVLANAIPTK